MIPIKIQNAQMGALSADKLFQSQKHLPQNQQRIFEAEIQKQMDDAHERTEAAEKSEKARIQNEKEQKDEQAQEQEEKLKKKQEDKTEEPDNRLKNIIEKKANGTIKHLDVKI